jgi:hypothetical protein
MLGAVYSLQDYFIGGLVVGKRTSIGIISAGYIRVGFTPISKVRLIILLMLL